MAKRTVNKESMKKIGLNIDKKYISDLYVELGDVHEIIRYYIFSNKSRWRNRFRHTFINFFSEKMKSNFKYDIYSDSELKITERISFEEIDDILENLNDCNYLKKTLDVHEINHLQGYLSLNNIEYEVIKNISNVMSSKVCFVVGKAGSGKTKLATKLGINLIKKYGKACVYINARSMSGNSIEDTFYKYFRNGLLLSTAFTEKIVKIYIFIAKIFKRDIYIIIDALNENEDAGFVISLLNFMNDMEDTSIKFIVTTRTEFFDQKYLRLIDENLHNNYSVVSMNEVRPSSYTQEIMLGKYVDYFNFTGNISTEVKYMIKNNPILMRMFFECYKNTSSNVNSLTRFKLFQYYINKLDDQYVDISIWDRLYDIAKIMVENRKYDYIEYEKLKDYKVDTMIHENVLLNITYEENIGDFDQNSTNVIAFTYDEVRDYVISKYLVKKYSEDEVMDFVCSSKEESIYEGILRYLYLHFTKKSNNIQAKDILFKHMCNVESTPFIQRRVYNKNEPSDLSDEDVNRELDDLGLEVIFNKDDDLQDFEKDYILRSQYNQRDIPKLIEKLIVNTMKDRIPNADLLIDELNKYLNDNEYESNLLILDNHYFSSLLQQLKNMNYANTMGLINALDRYLIGRELNG